MELRKKCFGIEWIPPRPGTLNKKRVFFWPSKSQYRQCALTSAMKIWDIYQNNVLQLHECNSIIMCSTNTAVHTIYNYMNNLLENYMICLAYCALVHVYVRFDPYSSYTTVLALYLPFLLVIKVIYTKYSKHWPYTVAYTIDCVCRKC